MKNKQPICLPLKNYSKKSRTIWTPEDEHKLMSLIDYRKLSYTQVARILGRSYDAIKIRRAKLLKIKHEQMKRFYKMK